MCKTVCDGTCDAYLVTCDLLGTRGHLECNIVSPLFYLRLFIEWYITLL